MIGSATLLAMMMIPPPPPPPPPGVYVELRGSIDCLLGSEKEPTQARITIQQDGHTYPGLYQPPGMKEIQVHFRQFQLSDLKFEVLDYIQFDGDGSVRLMSKTGSKIANFESLGGTVGGQTWLKFSTYNDAGEASKGGICISSFYGGNDWPVKMTKASLTRVD